MMYTYETDFTQCWRLLSATHCLASLIINSCQITIANNTTKITKTRTALVQDHTCLQATNFISLMKWHASCFTHKMALQLFH